MRDATGCTDKQVTLYRDILIESTKENLRINSALFSKSGCRFLSLFIPATGASRRMCELMPRTNPPTGNGSGS